MDIVAVCPECGKKIKVYVDTSCGIPNEAGVICEGCSEMGAAHLVGCDQEHGAGRSKGVAVERG